MLMNSWTHELMNSCNRTFFIVCEFTSSLRECVVCVKCQCQWYQFFDVHVIASYFVWVTLVAQRSYHFSRLHPWCLKCCLTIISTWYICSWSVMSHTHKWGYCVALTTTTALHIFECVAHLTSFSYITSSILAISDVSKKSSTVSSTTETRKRIVPQCIQCLIL